MQTFISFLIIASSILLYLTFYHKIDIEHIFEIMHSAFSRQFIFEIIPFIILFSVREMKFIDISSASEFFNSVIGRSLIGAFAFTFVTFSLNSVNPRLTDIIIDPTHSIKLNSFTPNINESEPIKENIDAYEKYITYATVK